MFCDCVIDRLCSVIVTPPGQFYTTLPLGDIDRLCYVIVALPGHFARIRTL